VGERSAKYFAQLQTLNENSAENGDSRHENACQNFMKSGRTLIKNQVETRKQCNFFTQMREWYKMQLSSINPLLASLNIILLSLSFPAMRIILYV
jgi:hypothetical protein